VSSEQGQLFSTDQQWLRVLKKCLLGKCTFTSDLLVESRGLVATSVEKQHIQQASKAFALDMESAAIFKAAQQLGLPCVAIRAIADPVTMDLPQSVVKSLNLAGQVDLAKLLKYLLFHPQELCALVNLGLHFHAAGKTLRKVAAQLDEILGFIEASGA
jgi:adenosylhomocysteine nucleosidase